MKRVMNYNEVMTNGITLTYNGAFRTKKQAIQVQGMIISGIDSAKVINSEDYLTIVFMLGENEVCRYTMTKKQVLVIDETGSYNFRLLTEVVNEVVQKIKKTNIPVVSEIVKAVKANKGCIINGLEHGWGKVWGATITCLDGSKLTWHSVETN